PPVHFGQAKWAALQAAEKSLKAFIAYKGESPRRTHDLMQQAKHCLRLGLPPLPPSFLTHIQCDADVRYGSPMVALEDAATAHHSALAVSRSIAHQIAGELGRL